MKKKEWINVQVHINYRAAKAAFFKCYPELNKNNDNYMPYLDNYVFEGIEPGIQGSVSVKVNIKNYSFSAGDDRSDKMFIAWLKSQNMIFNQEEEIYFDL